MPNILLISDDEVFATDLADQIRHYSDSYEVLPTDSKVVPDIIIIDENLDKLKNYTAGKIKVPVFFLSSDTDKVGDNCGASHIMLKPIVLSSFLDDLHSCINIFENSSNGYISFNRYVVRPIKKDIINQRNKEVIKLTEKEVAVLKYLYKNRDRIVSKNELLQEVWCYAPDVTTHTIETHIYRLRQKVEHDDVEAQLIMTVDGGYQLKE